MQSWWDSIEAVSKFGGLMFWLGVVFTLFAAASGVLSFVAGNRKEALKERQDEVARAQGAQTLEELKERTAPRRMNEQQQEQFLSIVKAGGRGRVVLSCVLRDSESADFARQIGALLSKAGWEVITDFNASTSREAATVVGVEIEWGGMLSGDSPANLLHRGFTATGYDASGSFGKQVAPDDGYIRLRVGTKPNAPQGVADPNKRPWWQR